MDRRSFLCGISAAGAVPAVAASAPAPPAPKENASVDWKVTGFTCVTCAVGLEVMLKGMKGVARARATWPGSEVSIGFDSHLIDAKTLRDFIVVCGFQVA